MGRLSSFDIPPNATWLVLNARQQTCFWKGLQMNAAHFRCWWRTPNLKRDCSIGPHLCGALAKNLRKWVGPESWKRPNDGPKSCFRKCSPDNNHLFSDIPSLLALWCPSNGHESWLASIFRLWKSGLAHLLSAEERIDLKQSSMQSAFWKGKWQRPSVENVPEPNFEALNVNATNLFLIPSPLHPSVYSLFYILLHCSAAHASLVPSVKQSQRKGGKSWHLLTVSYYQLSTKQGLVLAGQYMPWPPSHSHPTQTSCGPHIDTVQPVNDGWTLACLGYETNKFENTNNDMLSIILAHTCAPELHSGSCLMISVQMDDYIIKLRHSPPICLGLNWRYV